VTKEKVKQLEEELNATEKAYQEANKRLRADRAEMSLEELNVKPGEIVSYRGAKYIVKTADSSIHGWLFGYKVLKNGIVSTRLSCLYNNCTKET